MALSDIGPVAVAEEDGGMRFLRVSVVILRGGWSGNTGECRCCLHVEILYQRSYQAINKKARAQRKRAASASAPSIDGLEAVQRADCG